MRKLEYIEIDIGDPGELVVRARRGGRLQLFEHGRKTSEFRLELRARKITPHIARDAHQTKTGKTRKSAIDGRTTRHIGYAISQTVRKRIEEAIGWTKQVGGQARTSFRGRERVAMSFTFALAAYNLIRLPKLLGATP